MQKTSSLHANSREKKQLKRQEDFYNLYTLETVLKDMWKKCPQCQKIEMKTTLKEPLESCSDCGHHF